MIYKFFFHYSEGDKMMIRYAGGKPMGKLLVCETPTFSGWRANFPNCVIKGELDDILYHEELERLTILNSVKKALDYRNMPGAKDFYFTFDAVKQQMFVWYDGQYHKIKNFICYPILETFWFDEVPRLRIGGKCVDAEFGVDGKGQQIVTIY